MNSHSKFKSSLRDKVANSILVPPCTISQRIENEGRSIPEQGRTWKEMEPHGDSSTKGKGEREDDAIGVGCWAQFTSGFAAIRVAFFLGFYREEDEQRSGSFLVLSSLLVY
ncbi:hypothetical protein R3W88_032686 [Solanum pinnatisectum]|uniref:Uncharacterized protein n=1 Tax=Solanum pinnatisectum TaxID=50273 RepID=A0AAV9LRS7_9SOLN|nr:hypothetical protein R3W88_032686 [Solanum pinnatisectum]